MKNYWILKLSKQLLFVMLWMIPYFSWGQPTERKMEKDSYYMFPIKPGQRNSLAGTMGELRSSHFHTGLDIRTDGRTGLPVHAAADGYISRIAISSTGYGNAVYINHPNNTITVYAHLDKLQGDIEEYVRQEQYRRKTFALNLYFHKDRFKVKKGEVIALSGNSGSSGGPHLHFDIRDANNNVLNPLKYGFNEILDHTPPVVSKVSLKTMDKYSRINDQFGRFTFDVVRIGNDYVINKPITAYGNIGIELYGYDKLDNSRFRCGITEIEASSNKNTFFTQTIDVVKFAEQRNILAHMDYTDLRLTGRRYHKLYVDDGNFLNFYTTRNKGILNMKADGERDIEVTMKDSYNNVSKLNFKLVGKTPDYKVLGGMAKEDHELMDNTLKIQLPVQADKENQLEIYTPQKREEAPAYIINDRMAVYLYDMKNGLPLSYATEDGPVDLKYKDRIPPDIDYTYYDENATLKFSAYSLFDTLYFQNNYAYDSAREQEVFDIGDPFVPVRKYISVTLKPGKLYDGKYAVYALDSRGNKYYMGGQWNKGKISFSTRSFGEYTIAADSTPPKISPVKTNANDLVFKIWDDLSGIDEFECTVNGKWVLMNYDHKRSLIWSEKLNENIPFDGEVKLRLTDKSKNETIYKINL